MRADLEPVEFLCLIPADDLIVDRDLTELPCDECGESLAGRDCHLDDDGTYCEDCARKLLSESIAEAEAYARESCKAMQKFPRYDPFRFYSCTREEYEWGNRESYTPNAYRCNLRHSYTNYDSLICNLSKSATNTWDYIRYRAIRNRIEELIDEELEKLDADPEELQEACDSEMPPLEHLDA